MRERMQPWFSLFRRFTSCTGKEDSSRQEHRNREENYETHFSKEIVASEISRHKQGDFWFSLSLHTIVRLLHLEFVVVHLLRHIREYTRIYEIKANLLSFLCSLSLCIPSFTWCLIYLIHGLVLFSLLSFSTSGDVGLLGFLSTFLLSRCRRSFITTTLSTVCVLCCVAWKEQEEETHFLFFPSRNQRGRRLTSFNCISPLLLFYWEHQVRWCSCSINPVYNLEEAGCTKSKSEETWSYCEKMEDSQNKKMSPRWWNRENWCCIYSRVIQRVTSCCHVRSISPKQKDEWRWWF